MEIASGATAVQIGRPPIGSRDIEHIGSAQDDADLEIFKAAARQRLVAGQGELDLGLERTEPGTRGAGGGRCRSCHRGWATCAAASRMPTSG